MALWTPKVRNYFAPFGTMDPKELIGRNVICVSVIERSTCNGKNVLK